MVLLRRTVAINVKEKMILAHLLRKITDKYLINKQKYLRFKQYLMVVWISFGSQIFKM